MSYTDLDPPRGVRSFGHRSESGFGGARAYAGWHSHGRSDKGASDDRSGWEGSAPHKSFSIRRTLLRAEAFLDERGRGAWIAAMVLGFIVFWPVGLALLAYAIWSKRMFKGFCSHRDHHGHHRMERRYGMRSSGNTAFDAYRADTLRRLEDEQEAFVSFLDRLRAAKDKQEFDSFMEERVARARADAERRSDEDGSGRGPEA